MTTAETTDRPLGWARPWAAARPFARPAPRAGAWYPVVGETSGERLVLQVRGRRVAIQKKLLEVRSDRPRTFTVVIRTRETAQNVRAAGGPRIDMIYAVCPVCTMRMPILKDQPAATCAECGHGGEVAWWETG